MMLERYVQPRDSDFQKGETLYLRRVPDADETYLEGVLVDTEKVTVPTTGQARAFDGSEIEPRRTVREDGFRLETVHWFDVDDRDGRVAVAKPARKRLVRRRVDRKDPEDLDVPLEGVHVTTDSDPYTYDADTVYEFRFREAKISYAVAPEDERTATSGWEVGSASVMGTGGRHSIAEIGRMVELDKFENSTGKIDWRYRELARRLHTVFGSASERPLRAPIDADGFDTPYLVSKLDHLRLGRDRRWIRVETPLNDRRPETLDDIDWTGAHGVGPATAESIEEWVDRHNLEDASPTSVVPDGAGITGIGPKTAGAIEEYVESCLESPFTNPHPRPDDPVPLEEWRRGWSERTFELLVHASTFTDGPEIVVEEVDGRIRGPVGVCRALEPARGETLSRQTEPKAYKVVWLPAGVPIWKTRYRNRAVHMAWTFSQQLTADGRTFIPSPPGDRSVNYLRLPV